MRECATCANEYVLIAADADHARAARCKCQTPCPRCADVGFHFERDGRGYEQAVPCLCQRLDRRIRNFNAATLPARYSNATFQTFETPESGRSTLKSVAYRFAAEYAGGERGLLFFGSCGTGKTHLMVAILRHLLVNRGLTARFIEFMHLLSDLRACFAADGDAQALMAPLVQVPILAIDELGKGRANSDWETGVLDEIISKRYNAHRTTLFTTNFGIEGRGGLPSLEERVGERIYSRLAQMCQPQHFAVGDWRRRSAA